MFVFKYFVPDSFVAQICANSGAHAHFGAYLRDEAIPNKILKYEHYNYPKEHAHQFWAQTVKTEARYRLSCARAMRMTQIHRKNLWFRVVGRWNLARYRQKPENWVHKLSTDPRVDVVIRTLSCARAWPKYEKSWKSGAFGLAKSNNQNSAWLTIYNLVIVRVWRRPRRGRKLRKSLACGVRGIRFSARVWTAQSIY